MFFNGIYQPKPTQHNVVNRTYGMRTHSNVVGTNQLPEACRFLICVAKRDKNKPPAGTNVKFTRLDKPFRRLPTIRGR